MVSRLVVGALAGVTLACAGSAVARPDTVTEWNGALLDAIRVAGGGPGELTRASAVVQASVYDAVNSIHGGYQAYHVYTPTPGASMEAAAASAAHRALVAMFPSQQATFDARLATSLGAIPNGPAKTAGISLGTSVADQIVALRANDGATNTINYVPNPAPGFWQPTPPANAAAYGAHWRNVTPWTMGSASQFRPPAPPALTSAAYTTSFNQVKDLGAINSVNRTPDQTEMAIFWANDRNGTYKPMGHWNAIAQIIGEQRGNTLVDNARLFAAMNVAMADAAIVAWDAKYEYEFWRPVTGIHRADEDGNPLTAPDPNWQPLADQLPLPNTPPFPAYTSGHATFGATAAEVMREFFGTDVISFLCGTDEDPNMFRQFTSLTQAADENAWSRVYLGVHWDFDATLGLETGTQLGDYVFHNYFQAIPAPGTGALLGAGVLLLSRRRR